jgi:hypothetical protein
MNETVIMGHISSLANNVHLLTGMTTDCFTKIAASFKEQQRINRSVVLFSMFSTAYILVMHKKIERLSDEVKELKQTMEE